MSPPLQSSIEQPASGVALAHAIVSDTASGESPNPASRSALTGSGVASAIAVPCTSASWRVTRPSRRPSVAAKPLLVVARAVKPSDANSRADPRSHGLGITNGFW